MTRKAEEEFHSEFASGIEYPGRFQYSNRLVQLERPSATSAASAPVQRSASDGYHNQNPCSNNATDPPSSSSTLKHNNYSPFLIYPPLSQNTSTTTGEAPNGHCSNNSVQSITDSSTSTGNPLPSSSYLNYIQQRPDPTNSQQHPNIHHATVNVDPNLTTPSPNMQAPNNHHGAGGGGGGNPNPTNPHPHIGHHVTDNVNAANGNENAMNGNPNSTTDTSYASAYNLLMNHPSMAQAAALTAALQNILRNVPLPAQGGAGMAGYNPNNPHSLVSGVAGSVPGPGAQQIPQQAQQQVSQQQAHSITSSSSASTVHMGAPTQQQQQPSSIGAHLKMAHVASVPQTAAAAPSGSAATADHSQMVSISQLLNNAASTGHSFNNVSQPTQKHVAMSQHGMVPAAVSVAPINNLSSAMSTPSPHPMNTQPTTVTRRRKVKTVGPKVGGSTAHGVIPQPSPQVVSSSQPNVAVHQRAPPPTHRAAATPITTWSLPQLEQQVKFLQHTQQPVPGPLKLMLADAKRREEKKTMKRAANRKSASESRARKKAFVEEMTKTNERLKRHAQILALLPDLVVCIQLDGKITFASAQVSSIWFWKNKVTD